MGSGEVRLRLDGMGQRDEEGQGAVSHHHNEGGALVIRSGKISHESDMRHLWRATRDSAMRGIFGAGDSSAGEGIRGVSDERNLRGRELEC